VVPESVKPERVAMTGTPVAVVLRRTPDVREERFVPFIATTEVAPWVPVTSPCRTPEKLVAVPAVVADPAVVALVAVAAFPVVLEDMVP
jgi:hypothetical protein